MLFFRVFSAILFIANTKLCMANIKSSMKEFEIVPDVIDVPPFNLLEITYPSGVTVKEGNELTPTQVQHIPSVVWDANAIDYYTLIMADPDAPSRRDPIYREYRHWTVVNIPGNDVSKGQTLFGFIGSGPPYDTGLHRYVFLVYKQNGKLYFDEPIATDRDSDNRGKSSIKKFAKKYNLGNPIAGNFYQAKYDDYVATLNAQLGEPDMDIANSMKIFEIVPDVIDTPPTKFIDITYPSGAKVQEGNELTPTQVKDVPTISWDANPNDYYTLIMTDPDAPSRKNPTLREVRHWTVVNIPGNNLSKGETIFEFIGSGPPVGTGLHRYIFLLYKQNGILNVDEPRTTKRSRKNRMSSSTRKFAEKYRLGNPVAGNFYLAQYDEYVPLLHAQFTE